MKTPTAKEVRAAAASVHGARSAGIETVAAKAAPALLTAAEAALIRLLDKADKAMPSAPSMRQEVEYAHLAARAVAYADAVKQLRSALAG